MLRNILGTPPSPPPNVPALDESKFEPPVRTCADDMLVIRMPPHELVFETGKCIEILRTTGSLRSFAGFIEHPKRIIN